VNSNSVQNSNELQFLKSSMHDSGPCLGLDEVIKWLEVQNHAVKVNISKIRFDELKMWGFDQKNGSLRHDSGGFFSIDGIHVETNWSVPSEWDQPIINQPEIGYLGFITKEISGVLHFLVQAKIEPGNINYVQLSPTLQATRSNYNQLHKGKTPLYLEYFQNATSGQIMLDQLQSEQGARFLKKRNRNIIIKIDDDIEVRENFTWVTLGQLKRLMQHDNLVNMDSRTVVSGIPFGSFKSDVVGFFNYFQADAGNHGIGSCFLKSAITSDKSLHTTEEIITFLTQLKSIYDLRVTQCPLDSMAHWSIDDYEIFHEERKFFKAVAVDVHIESREVAHWTQPMIEPAQEGLCAFICKEIDGLLHFAVQAKLECGNYDIIEFAPTVQTLTGNYKTTEESLPFLDYVLNCDKTQVYFDTLQSEEGGRFYKEQNRNMIILAGDEIPVQLPEKFIWMTLNQLYTFLKFNNYLNIQARSLIAAISFNGG